MGALEVEVFFFDFGETVECSQDNIKELPEQFHTHPPALVSHWLIVFFMCMCFDFH